jgi:tetratricopeptide (TPR) repeat protein
MKHLHRFISVFFIIAFLSACGVRLPAVGIEGHYRQGRSLLIRPDRGTVGQSVSYLEEVAKRDPFYKDTLTLLARALYYQGVYQDAFQFAQRAVVVDKEDGIAWLMLGLIRLRLGDDEAGLENVKTGVALINKVSKNGYRGYVRWDINDVIRSSIRRTMVVITRDGLINKDEVIRASEQILTRMDDEELSQEAEYRRAAIKEDFKR